MKIELVETVKENETIKYMFYVGDMIITLIKHQAYEMLNSYGEVMRSCPDNNRIKNTLMEYVK